MTAKSDLCLYIYLLMATFYLSGLFMATGALVYLDSLGVGAKENAAKVAIVIALVVIFFEVVILRPISTFKYLQYKCKLSCKPISEEIFILRDKTAESEKQFKPTDELGLLIFLIILHLGLPTLFAYGIVANIGNSILNKVLIWAAAIMLWVMSFCFSAVWCYLYRETAKKANTLSTLSLNERTPVSEPDAAFSDRLGVASAPELALAIRRAVASMSGLSPTDITTEIQPAVLHNKMLTGWDTIDFLVLLERELKIPIDFDMQLPPFVPQRFFFWHREAPLTFGQWVLQAIPEIRKHLSVPNRTT